MDIKYNAQCCEIKKYNYDAGFLDDCVEATYIIHLKDNGRLERIQEQLKEYHPTKVVYIAFNEGFKKGGKPDFIKNSTHDLIDVNFQILKHSKEMKYDNILILEDDFIFSEKIKEDFHKNNITSFLKKNSHKPYYYLLGCVPILQVPYDSYNYRPILCGGTHAVIYNNKMKDIILSHKQEDIKDWDDLGIWLTYKYTYYTPLCYQLFPETENSKSWGMNNNFLIYWLKQSAKVVFNMLNMDKSIEPGYSIFYILSKILPFLIVFFVFFFIVFVIMFIVIVIKIKNKQNSNKSLRIEI
jgi:hypothetical protein